MYVFIYLHCGCLQTHQKKASDFIMDGCEPPCGCWDLNLEEEQSVFLPTEPSHQPRKLCLKKQNKEKNKQKKP